MEIATHAVLQRDGRGKAQVRLDNGDSVELSTGGPYEVAGTHDVLVGDLWVLAGQSNMEGVGNLVEHDEPSPLVHSFQMSEQWAVAEEPLHWLTESPRPIHHALLGREPIPDRFDQRDPNRAKGAGLGLAFAKARQAQNGVPIGLIPCAHGGSSMAQWDPRLRDEGGNSLYGAAIQKIKMVGGNVAGILWYQGESETNPDGVAHYHERMIALVNAFRADLGQPDLPFYYVQIGRVIGAEFQGWQWSVDGWNGVREAQRRFSTILPGMAMTSAIDGELDDLIHVGTHSLKRIGRRLAQLANGAPGIDLVGAKIAGSMVEVRFSGVQDMLRSAGRPSGFSLRDRDGNELPIIHKVTLDGANAWLHLTFDSQYAQTVLPPQTNLWYGWGLDPSCNVTDMSDAPVPAFGPYRIS